jgi:Domain of unknown function (DUF4331)
MKLRYTIGLIGLALAGAVIGGCSANGSMANTNPAVAQLPFANSAKQVAYKQIELLSRPAVKEAFEMFEDHNKTNRSEPYNDPVLQGEIESFAAMFRDQTTSQTLQAVLYPNVMKVDLSQNTTTASYLGYETGGATGSKFGGRALNDDIIDISLGAIFGNTLSALGLIPDDHKEVPCLTTDNVAYDKSNTKTFPYIQAPL